MRPFFLLLVSICFLKVQAGEIILQNGVNGYSGCMDTHLSEPGMGSDGPHGLSPALQLNTGS